MRQQLSPIFLITTCAVLLIASLGHAQNNAKHFALNGTGTKSDLMFSNETMDAKERPALFKAELGHNLSDGVTITATGSEYPVKLIPITLSQGMGTRSGNRITYAVAPGVKIIYTFKGNGVKEDIVFDHPSDDSLDLTFRLELNPMLEARLDKKGNVVIYGPNAILSNYIQAGDEKSTELILKARQRAPKDNLLYVIPAPVIIDGMGRTYKQMAHYSLEKSILTLHAERLAHLPAPVTIDPTIVVNTTAQFMTGNTEGMISFDTDAISRAVPGSGSIDIWATTTSFTTARYGHTSVAYNGCLYVIGGWSGSALNDVQFAPINANGTVGTWTATTSLPTARYDHTTVVYNGYLYVIGGFNGSSYLNDVYYAPINANGTVGTWTATTSFTTARIYHSSAVYNGYLYVIGGTDAPASYLNDVQFAPINANGTVGTWAATTSFPTARYSHSSVAYNGYLYVIGGYDSYGAYLNDVHFASINANGTVGIWTATTSFATARDSHTSVAYNGYLYIIGGENDSGSLNDVQFAPINGNGAVDIWTATASFTTARRDHTSAVYNGHLYILGGFNPSSYLNDVQYASIPANGAVGTWTYTTSFATERCGHTSVIYNGYLYVIGGAGDDDLYNDVQFAPINANGTVGPWTATTSFTTARWRHTSVVYNGYLYVIGGYDDNTWFNDVQFAYINANGTVGTWTATTSFPTARYGHSSVAYNGYLYVIGGYDSYGAYLNDVQFAPINANGTVGTWAATTSFPTPRDSHSSVVYNGYLYVIGGEGEQSSGSLNDVQFAPINANGTVGTWTATTSLPLPSDSHTSVVYNGYVYVIGGKSGPVLNDVQFAPIYGKATIGTVSTWAATTSFPTPREGHSSVAYNGYLYVIGGYDGAYLNDVHYAPINTSGEVGTWTATTSFSIARSGHTSVVYNGYLYVICGNSSSGYSNDVQFAPINANGTVGTWAATSSLPLARERHTSVVYNGYLYVIGGIVGPYLDDVQFAPINANGTVGSWAATTSFTTARYGHTSVAYNGYLYVIGGYSDGAYHNDVQFAPINANGTIGTWNTTTSFPTARDGHTSAVYNGYLYVIGGQSISSTLNDIQYAPINNNGSIDTWTATTGFTTARMWHTSVVYNGYLYILGGNNGAYLNDVHYATIIGPAARARYSKLLDIGSDQIVESIQFVNSGAKGFTNLTYTVAPSSTAVFGPRNTIPDAMSGAFYTTGLNTCGRYMWVHFDLDDTLSASIDNNGLNGRGNILSFAVTYDALAGLGTSLLVSKSLPDIHLSWSVSPLATSYNVLRCNAATIPCTPVTIASPTANSYNDPVLANPNNYWYLIQAVNGACISP